MTYCIYGIAQILREDRLALLVEVHTHKLETSGAFDAAKLDSFFGNCIFIWYLKCLSLSQLVEYSILVVLADHELLAVDSKLNFKIAAHFFNKHSAVGVVFYLDNTLEHISCLVAFLLIDRLI